MHPSHRFPNLADPTVLQLLKLTDRPDVISLSGGTPSPEALPLDLVKEAVSSIDLNLQYSATQGNESLRSVVAQRLSKQWGSELTPNHILITTGSQQALDLIGRTFIDPGDTLLVEDPTYFVALYAFGAYEPRYQSVTLEDSQTYQSWPNAKALYLVPTFQNPQGTTLALAQRQAITATLHTKNITLIEDDPYSELWFESPPPPPIYTLAPDQTIYLTTLSKTVGPALRIGIVVAHPDTIKQLAIVKTGMDLCTSRYLQDIAEKVLTHKRFDDHLTRIRAFYHKRAQALVNALTAHMPPGVTWTTPAGGLFTWVTLPNGLDSAALFDTVLAQGVAYVPGYIFRPSREPSSSLRLTYASANEAELERAVTILAGVIKEKLSQ